MEIIKNENKIKSRLIQGLEQYNLTFEEFYDKWKYCGGDGDKPYFRLCFKDRELPKHKSNCVCGHDIIKNCYITNGVEILILGKCCIKRFMKHNTRTCEICEKPHKNRLVNLCNDCKTGHCHECKKPCNPKFDKCFKCKNPDMHGKCYICKKDCNPNFQQCYPCYDAKRLKA